MDLRNLIKLAPAMFRGPLIGLLDRIERVERMTQSHGVTIDALIELNDQLREQLAELRKT